MYRHILFPTDGSELSRKAIREGIAFAKSINAKITGVHARPHLKYDYLVGLSRAQPTDLESADKRAEEASMQYLDEIAQEAQRAGVPCECVGLVSDVPFDAIITTAKEKGCDLIFMASHGRRGMSGIVLGSETQKVLTHCTIPVLVTR
jgi:nucleotide-binding universal stress UspA family protein